MSAFDELAHRVNNLLGTIAVQAEVARAEDSLEAHRQALRYIVESADRTRIELAELIEARRRSGDA
ncbi:MAG: hypothetical protein KDC98_18635 [Planctomycetes bacterium]|nr:hypothetical protein [Planctomycetota bacterium]